MSDGASKQAGRQAEKKKKNARRWVEYLIRLVGMGSR